LNFPFSKLIVSLQTLYQLKYCITVWIYFQIGLKHVLDIYAYDHVLFLIALAVPFLLRLEANCTFSVYLQLDIH
jgi:hypothetical protein